MESATVLQKTLNAQNIYLIFGRVAILSANIILKYVFTLKYREGNEMRVETKDYGAGPRLLISFMQGHAHAITLEQAIELRDMIDEQVSIIKHNSSCGLQIKNEPANCVICEHPYHTDVCRVDGCGCEYVAKE